MNDFIACCGLDCEACEARLATVNNDNELRIKVSKEWSALNGVEITPQMINCSGRRIPGPKTVFCDSICTIRQCAMSKKNGDLRRLSGIGGLRKACGNYKKQS